MNFSKANNQYYAAYIESRVVSYINNEEYVLPPLIKDFSFSTLEIAEMDSDAKMIADYIGGASAEWVGRSCSTANCDIIVDGREIEIKYVSKGRGTYFNTSWSYFNEVMNFTPFTEYTHSTICPYLEKFFGKSVYKNLSPVSRDNARVFSKTEDYKELVEIDKEMRKRYVTDLHAFFTNHPDKLRVFIHDMLTKSKSGKLPPQEMIVFTHEDKKIQKFTREEIEEIAKSADISFDKTNLGFKFSRFRAAISWQNHIGLNNPTIRIYLT